MHADTTQYARPEPPWAAPLAPAPAHSPESVSLAHATARPPPNTAFAVIACHDWQMPPQDRYCARRRGLAHAAGHILQVGRTAWRASRLRCTVSAGRHVARRTCEYALFLASPHPIRYSFSDMSRCRGCLRFHYKVRGRGALTH